MLESCDLGCGRLGEGCRPQAGEGGGQVLLRAGPELGLDTLPRWGTRT